MENCSMRPGRSSTADQDPASTTSCGRGGAVSIGFLSSGASEGGRTLASDGLSSRVGLGLAPEGERSQAGGASVGTSVGAVCREGKEAVSQESKSICGPENVGQMTKHHRHRAERDSSVVGARALEGGTVGELDENRSAPSHSLYWVPHPVLSLIRPAALVLPQRSAGNEVPAAGPR